MVLLLLRFVVGGGLPQPNMKRFRAPLALRKRLSVTELLPLRFSRNGVALRCPPSPRSTASFTARLAQRQGTGGAGGDGSAGGFEQTVAHRFVERHAKVHVKATPDEC